MALFIFYLALAIGVSFWCSILEAAFLKMTPGFVDLMIEEKKPFAKRLEWLMANQGAAIGAILTLNTIAHTAGAIGVGAQTDDAFGPAAAKWYIQTGVPVVMTLLILIASEIIPKNIGAQYWRKLAGFTTGSLMIIVTALRYTGILWLLRKFARLVGGAEKDSHFAAMSRTEIGLMARRSEASGKILEVESRTIQNLVRFNKITVEDIMTPRTVLVTLPRDMPLREAFTKTLEETPFTRIPLRQDDKDTITGYILKDEVLDALVKDEDSRVLSEFERDLVVINEETTAPDAFNQLVEAQEHIALVVGPFGGTAGVITIEDVIETLLGLEIVDEEESVADLQKLARENWRKRAMRAGVAVDRLVLKADDAPREESPEPPDFAGEEDNSQTSEDPKNS